MEVNITIDASLDTVKNITSYTGKSLQNNDLISASDDDSKLISILQGKSISDFMGKIARLKPVLNGSVITITVPANFDEDIVPGLNRAVSDLMNYNILSSWFFITRQMDDTKVYSELANNCYIDVERLLNKRTK